MHPAPSRPPLPHEGRRPGQGAGAPRRLSGTSAVHGPQPALPAGPIRTRARLFMRKAAAPRPALPSLSAALLLGFLLPHPGPKHELRGLREARPGYGARQNRGGRAGRCLSGAPPGDAAPAPARAETRDPTPDPRRAPPPGTGSRSPWRRSQESRRKKLTQRARRAPRPGAPQPRREEARGLQPGGRPAPPRPPELLLPLGGSGN